MTISRSKTCEVNISLYLNDLALKRHENISNAFKSSKEIYSKICPHCGGPAYIGMNEVDCQAKCTEGKY